MFFLFFGFKLHSFFSREVTRKTEFAVWQDEWCKKYAPTVLEQRRLAAMQQSKEEEQKGEEQQTADQKVTKKAEGPSPGKYSEWVAEQWNRKEEERLSRLLLAKKHLNREVLEKQHVPIKKYEEEKQKKKRRQEERLANSQKTFNETVAILFPDIVKEKPAPPPDPYAGGEPKGEKEEKYAEYTQLQGEMIDYVQSHPFIYTLNWKAVLQAGRLRRQMLETQQPKPTHRRRHEMYKIQRQQEEEEEKKKVQHVAMQRRESLHESVDSDIIIFDDTEEPPLEEGA